MSEQLRAHTAEFEQKYRHETAHERAGGIEKNALSLAGAAIRFSFIERVPRYTPETRENDAEHSFMLALIAQDIASEYFPDLDAGLVSQFSVVHDLLELETGDIATFAISDEDLRIKRSNEHAKLDEICAQLPPHTALLLKAYEEQELPEARFVRMIDKMLPVLVDIMGSGAKVMHEDYQTFTHEALANTNQVLRERLERMFPDEALSPLHIARNSLVKKFSRIFEPTDTETSS